MHLIFHTNSFYIKKGKFNYTFLFVKTKNFNYYNSSIVYIRISCTLFKGKFSKNFCISSLRYIYNIYILTTFFHALVIFFIPKLSFRFSQEMFHLYTYLKENSRCYFFFSFLPTFLFVFNIQPNSQELDEFKGIVNI